MSSDDEDFNDDRSVDDEEPFELTVKGLQGRWMHSLGFIVSVKDDVASFPGGLTCKIKNKKETVYIEELRPEHPDGKVYWRANPKKSDASEIHWKNLHDESKCRWEYEDDGQVHDFEADDFPAEEVLGKRKRNVVSYIELGKKMDMMEAGLINEQGESLDQFGNVKKKPKKSPARKPINAGLSVAAQEVLRDARMTVKKWLMETSEQRKLILEKKGAITKLLPCADQLETGKGKAEFENFIRQLGGTCMMRKNAESKMCFELRFTQQAVNRYKAMQSNGGGGASAAAASRPKPVSADGHTVEDITKWRIEMATSMLPETRAMQILKWLSAFPMDLQTLQSSKIGVSVTKYKKEHPSLSIQSDAARLVAKWRDMFKKK